jgi:hypothetical protein
MYSLQKRTQNEENERDERQIIITAVKRGKNKK